MTEKLIPDANFAGQLPLTDELPGAPEMFPTPEAETPYRILNTPELRLEYLHLTDELVCEMAKQGTETAVFLDKSARPVAWMIQELWDQLVPLDKDGHPKLKRPDIKFLNIDREQWGAILGRSEVNAIDVKSLPLPRIEELRKVMAPVGTIVKEDEPYEGPSMLDGKKVLVIDEVSNSGDTLSMAHRILTSVFPKAEVQRTYWMIGHNKRDQKSGVVRNTKNAIWYSDRETTGRLVAGRDTYKSSTSNSSRQRIGGYWLSTRFRDEPDKKGLQLKAEVKQMARDLKDHKLLYVPSTSWSVKAQDERIPRLNGITVAEYVAMKKIAGEDNAAFQKMFRAHVERETVE